MHMVKRQEKAAINDRCFDDLLNVGVITDMVLAIAVIAIALGAVSEFQIGMGNIRSAADGTPMCAGCLWLGSGCLIRASVERNGLMLLVSGCIFCMSGGSSGVDSPGLG